MVEIILGIVVGAVGVLAGFRLGRNFERTGRMFRSGE